MSTIYSRTEPSRFYLEGQFLGFASGKKSPFKYLVVAGQDGNIRVKLRKALRLMLFRYLMVGDWVRITGTQTWDSDQDEMLFKADEVVRISEPAEQCAEGGAQGRMGTEEAIAIDPSPSHGQPTPRYVTAQSEQNSICSEEGSHLSSKKAKKKKAPTVLICQKSSCRKRGGLAVGQMVERSLSELGLADHVKVKYTGCMDRCKSGPHVVFAPEKAKYSRVKPNSVPKLVKKHCPSTVSCSS